MPLPYSEADAPNIYRIDPLYVTYEYITRNRKELASYLEQGRLDHIQD